MEWLSVLNYYDHAQDFLPRPLKQGFTIAEAERLLFFLWKKTVTMFLTLSIIVQCKTGEIGNIKGRVLTLNIKTLTLTWVLETTKHSSNT